MQSNRPFGQVQREFLSVCPGLATYAALHLDSIGKIINHVLAVTMVCDVFLFFSSWSVSLLPNIGFNTVLISFLLCVQTICVLLIINNNRISALSFLSPTEFMIGVAFGITLGATALSLVLSGAFRRVSRCGHEPPNSRTPASAPNGTDTTSSENAFGDPVYQYICEQHAGAMAAVWFWSGLVFWFNFCTCLLLAVGRSELTQNSHYEHIGGGGESGAHDFEEQFRRTQAGFPAGDALNQTPTPSFVGDYATIPEIRPGNGTTPGSSIGGAHVQSV